MNKNIIIIGGAVALLIGGAVLFVLNNDSAELSGTSNGRVEKVIVIRGHQIPAGEIVIDMGTTIVWENKDSFVGLPYNRHTITTGTVDSSGTQGTKGVVPNSGSGIPDNLISHGLNTNESFSYTFEEPGEYTFYIAEHPLVSGEGKIVVKVVDRPLAVEIESRSFEFTPNVIRAKVGEPIQININATGGHTFTIDELNVNVETPHGQNIVEFTPDKEGTFQFYCAVPGHREAGQVGTFIVEAGGTSSGDSSALRVGENGLYVSDQKPGKEINANLVFMNGDGFVVIHESDNGNPGAIIGNSVILSSGDSNNVVIELSRMITDNESFIAMLHKDNGDKTFNPSEDSSVVDEQGNIIQMSFQVSSNAEDSEGISL